MVKHRFKKVSSLRQVLLITLAVILWLTSNPGIASAENDRDHIKVLIIYTTPDGQVTQHQRMLDMLVGHFTKDITVMSSESVVERDVEGVTHLFYFGEVKGVVPSRVQSIFDRFNGHKFAMGHNTSKLGDSFNFFETEESCQIDELQIGEGEKVLIDSKMIQHVILKKPDTRVWISASHKGNPIPLYIQNEKSFYFATPYIDNIFSPYLAEVLHDFFQVPHTHLHPAYLRLEDIHPMVDPEELEKIADLLSEKGIPYMISVVPVYRNPETQREIHLSDSPKLLNLLKKMQKEGGSIIMHGYTHQYRDDETGEGFEFWDVENNMPISAPATEEVTKKEESDFDSEEEYEEYVNKVKEFETDYISTKIEKGIHDLVSNGLYPLAFEPPHYTMSQNGYGIVSNYFSTYVGQLQLSDEDWRIMNPSPSISSPSFLNGMTFLPETLGYIPPDDPEAIERVKSAVESQQIVRDGVMAAFYHPFIGVEPFKELMATMETIPDIYWIDLKEQGDAAQTDHIRIASSDGRVDVDVDYGQLLFSSPEFYKPLVKNGANTTLWIIGALSMMMVTLFFIYIYTFSRKRKRMEASSHDHS
ncbi:polysaccharide deacetylase family protein [Pontibacillus sp. ALD_SL1]|uniref:polysaccharide deacetylase family protein n=1 Tax=Pontibacillus sp. ALD_SL1 TaxID=2777185 RepID=UPI001A96C089|nr:polysaccharide deacetylase family protein [Pontibacillus sp. ALD_SL1]QSS99697.1 polysaccharide deacetylase family protein [Pontibacillus sp. ALD_SL1]